MEELDLMFSVNVKRFKIRFLVERPSFQVPSISYLSSSVAVQRAFCPDSDEKKSGMLVGMYEIKP